MREDIDPVRWVSQRGAMALPEHMQIPVGSIVRYGR